MERSGAVSFEAAVTLAGRDRAREQRDFVEKERAKERSETRASG